MGFKIYITARVGWWHLSNKCNWVGRRFDRGEKRSLISSWEWGILTWGLNVDLHPVYLSIIGEPVMRTESCLILLLCLTSALALPRTLHQIGHYHSQSHLAPADSATFESAVAHIEKGLNIDPPAAASDATYPEFSQSACKALTEEQQLDLLSSAAKAHGTV